MALQNEKNSRYLLRDWKPENPALVMTPTY